MGVLIDICEVHSLSNQTEECVCKLQEINQNWLKEMWTRYSLCQKSEICVREGDIDIPGIIGIVGMMHGEPSPIALSTSNQYKNLLDRKAWTSSKIKSSGLIVQAYFRWAGIKSGWGWSLFLRWDVITPEIPRHNSKFINLKQRAAFSLCTSGISSVWVANSLERMHDRWKYVDQSSVSGTMMMECNDSGARMRFTLVSNNLA